MTAAPLLSNIRLRKVGMVLAIAFCMARGHAPCFAQYNASFDSAYRAAATTPETLTRLSKLKPLVNGSYDASVFQTISFGRALLATADDARSDTDRYQAHIVLCTGYERARNFSRAVDHGLKAVDIAGRRKDYVRQVRALQVLAFTYGSMGLMSGDGGDFDKALHYCSEAVGIGDEHGIKEEEPYTLTTAADVNGMARRYDTAVSLYRNAIASHKREGAIAPVALYINFGNTLDLKKDFGGALAAYATADSINATQGASDFIRLKIASNRAILYNSTGRMRESEALAKEVLAGAQKIGATDIQVDIVGHLKSLYQKEGRYADALVYADSLAGIRERMLNAEKTGQVAEMQARYEAGVKDQQIAGQEETIRLARTQSLLQWTAIGLLLVAGITAYLGMRRSRILNRKITAQQAQLLAQKTELQRINEMKDQLFSLIGHDLRTPLNSLTAYATLLEHQPEMSPEKARQYSADLRQTLGYTAALLENLLHFAKTQMQATQPYPETISLSTVVESAAGLLGPAINAKGIRLVKDFSPDTSAFADEDMTALILRNLLANAVKYSAAGGSITLSIRPQGEDHIRCTVEDNGAGMDAETVAMWNGPDAPAPVRSEPGTNREKGAGLGLMLSKTFAGMMGGNLQVESSVGNGSAFSLVLPRRGE